MYVPWEILLGGASFVSLAGQHTFCWQNCDNQAVIYKHKCLYISYRAHIGWIFFLLKKHEHLWKKCNFTMFIVKLGTPSRANYEHFHVYLAYRRQTGTVVTRQTYDRAPRLTRPPTAHISRGDLQEHYSERCEATIQRCLTYWRVSSHHGEVEVNVGSSTSCCHTIHYRLTCFAIFHWNW